MSNEKNAGFSAGETFKKVSPAPLSKFFTDICLWDEFVYLYDDFSLNRTVRCSTSSAPVQAKSLR